MRGSCQEGNVDLRAKTIQNGFVLMLLSTLRIKTMDQSQEAGKATE